MVSTRAEVMQLLFHAVFDGVTMIAKTKNAISIL